MQQSSRWGAAARLVELGEPFTAAASPRRATRRRDPFAVLARARVLSLISIVAEGHPAQEALPDVARFELASALTSREEAILCGDAEATAFESWQLEAVVALAWSLGLVDALAPTDPDTPGPIQEQLMDERAGALLAPASDDELLEELIYLDAYVAGYERLRAASAAPLVVGLAPQHGPLSFESAWWRREALAWAMDASAPWG